MAVLELIDLTNDEFGDWVEADLTGIFTCYVIAIKEEAEDSEELLDATKITKVGLELGIDAGLKDDEEEIIPITTQYLILDFKDETSRDLDVNEKTAFTRLNGVPSKLYIKPLFVDLDGERVYEGKAPIKINISK